MSKHLVKYRLCSSVYFLKTLFSRNGGVGGGGGGGGGVAERDILFVHMWQCQMLVWFGEIGL